MHAVRAGLWGGAWTLQNPDPLVWLGGVGPDRGLQSQSVTRVTVTMSQVGTRWWGTEGPAEANCLLRSQQNVHIHNVGGAAKLPVSEYS